MLKHSVMAIFYNTLLIQSTSKMCKCACDYEPLYTYTHHYREKTCVSPFAYEL